MSDVDGHRTYLTTVETSKAIGATLCHRNAEAVAEAEANTSSFPSLARSDQPEKKKERPKRAQLTIVQLDIVRRACDTLRRDAGCR